MSIGKEKMIEQPGKKKMLLFSGSSNEQLATKVEDNLESLLAAQKILEENKRDIIEDFGQYGKQQYNTLYDKIDSRIIILKQMQ